MNAQTATKRQMLVQLKQLIDQAIEVMDDDYPAYDDAGAPFIVTIDSCIQTVWEEGGDTGPFPLDEVSELASVIETATLVRNTLHYILRREIAERMKVPASLL